MQAWRTGEMAASDLMLFPIGFAAAVLHVTADAPA